MLRKVEGFGLTSDAKGWTKFGWQGITVDIPADWSLGAISGDKKEGYLRLDDADMPRMEVKWRDAQKGTPALTDVVQKYLDDLEKSVTKKKVDIKTENGFDISRIVRPLPDRDKMIQGFYWKSSTKAYGMATFCRECRRIVILQIVSPIDTDVRALISRVFSSFEDHAIGGAELWSVYDMNFKIPSEFQLKDQKLMPGYLQFSFIREGDSFVLDIERWGLTDVLLRELTVREWYEGQYASRLKGNKVNYEEVELHGHTGFKASGETGRWFHEWRLAFERLTRSKTPTHTHSVFWHCEESKKIFVVNMADRDPINPIVNYVASHVKCHENETD
jgi:hypothetical protein